MRKRALLVPVLLIAACRDEPKEIAVSADENNNFTATMPDGTQAAGEDEYGAAIIAQIVPIDALHPVALTVTTASKKDGGGPGLTFGKFHISIRIDSSYLEGCVNRGFTHLVVVVENDSMPAEMIELNLIAWFEGSKPCFAVMNTGFIGYGWCYKLCVTNTKGGVKLGIRNGLISAGVSTAAAALIAIVVAPVAEVALAM